jgi:4,5-dihydroxyphthalate decarboxylase
MMPAVTSTKRLRALLGDHPTTHALRRGAVSSPRIQLEFADVAVPNKAFKRVVRDLDFDVAELALMTFLMARSRGVPLWLLPVVVFSRNPLRHLMCDGERSRLTPRDLVGRRVGVRSYTTTTAVWIRALLADQFNLSFDDIEWITLEEGHVAGVPDPVTVRRDTSGADLVTMLRGGTVDAVIADAVPADGPFVSVVSDPEAACQAWQLRHGARTLNHVIVVGESIANDDAVLQELFGMFRDSRAMGGAGLDPASTPIGLEANRRNLEIAIAVADHQRLLAQPLTIEDLITPALRSLA